MLASGQMSFDLKNEFLRKRESQTDYPPADRSPPDDNFQPEDSFKIVGHDLKLNQSAFSPEKQAVANQKLEDLANKSDSVMLKVSTVFPFTFFINDVIVDPYKVTIIFREFFWSEHVHSVLIRDILDVEVETSIFFATLRIVDQGYVENTIDIAYLKKADALKVRKVIQGLIIAHRQAVDLSILAPSDIRSKSEELGKVKGYDSES